MIRAGKRLDPKGNHNRAQAAGHWCRKFRFTAPEGRWSIARGENPCELTLECGSLLPLSVRQLAAVVARSTPATRSRLLGGREQAPWVKAGASSRTPKLAHMGLHPWLLAVAPSGL